MITLLPFIILTFYLNVYSYDTYTFTRSIKYNSKFEQFNYFVNIYKHFTTIYET